MAVGQAVAPIAGGLVGTLSGFIGGAAANKQAARDRRRFRKGMRRGEAKTEREVYDVLNSPEYQAARQFALGTFGIDITQQGAGGVGGISFGGQTYTEAPTGVALEGPRRRAANQLAKRLAAGYNAQERIQSGTTLAGMPMSEFEGGQESPLTGGQPGLSIKDQRVLADIDSYVQRAGQLSAAERQIVERQFAARAGVSLQQGLQRLGPQTGGPVELDPGTMENIQTLGPGGQAAMQPGVVAGFGMDSPLARDFVRGVGQAQTSRGLYSSHAAAAAEASGLAAFNFEQQKALLPFMLGLSTFGSDYARGARQANIAQEVQRISGGAAMYGMVNPFGNQPVIAAAAQGALAGAGAGGAIGATLSGGNTAKDTTTTPTTQAATYNPYAGSGPDYGTDYQNYIHQQGLGSPYIL